VKEDILDFEVRLYSPDGVNSPVVDFLDELSEVSEDLHIKCVDNILNLPEMIFIKHKNIKSFKIKKYTLFELKIRYKNDAFRFFFIMEKPDIIVLYGFTKKTQKTEKKDIKNGVKNLKDYLKNQKSVSFEV
jgi:phage-related protein